jgi:asparagine synthetase B (glutamine-hydrolysing)
MCGIAGIYDIKIDRGRQELQATIDAMTDTLVHRGPDSRGTWIDPEKRVMLLKKSLN